MTTTKEDLQANWSMLPDDLLSTIASKLSPSIDFLCFGQVCKSWRSVAGKDNYPPARQLPLLMLAEDESGRSLTRNFFSPSDGSIHELPLPEARRTRIVGSTGGWLILVTENLTACMLNPMSRTRVDLPPLASFPSYDEMRKHYGYSSKHMQTTFINKACSSSGGPKKCIVVVITSNRKKLAFARPGDKSWNGIGTAKQLGIFFDVLYFKGAFYALTYQGCVVICNFSHGVGADSVRVIAPAPFDEPKSNGAFKFLVECSGDLLQVVRLTTMRNGVPRTIKFEVYKWKSGQCEWEEVTRLGDHALFVGTNSSVSIAVADAVGCKANCIYFTDPNKEWYAKDGGGDMGVFNMEDNTVLPHYPGYSRSKISPPIWVQPTLWH